MFPEYISKNKEVTAAVESHNPEANQTPVGGGSPFIHITVVFFDPFR